MSINNRNQVSYGFSQALTQYMPEAIIANRAPGVGDLAPLGQLWLDQANVTPYFLVQIVNGLATWTSVTAATGVFTSITVTTGPNDIEGTTTINTSGSASTSIGNSTGASGIAMLVGTGNFSLDGAGASTYSIGSSTTTGTIVIGGTAQSGLITLGNSSATNILNLGIGAGATTVNIATGVTNAKTINVGTGAAMANNINIGGTGANVIALGNTQTAGSVTIGNAMVGGTISLGGAPMTGILTLGRSTAGQTINIGNAVNVGAQIVNIANGASGANSTVNILSGNATAGLQVLNLLNGTQGGDVNIGTGVGAANTILVGNTGTVINLTGSTVSLNPNPASPLNTVIGNSNAGSTTFLFGGSLSLNGAAVDAQTTIGNHTGVSLLSLLSGTGGVVVDSGPTAGNFSVVKASNSAAGTTVVLNAHVGVATYTGNVTAAAAAITLVLTNSFVTVGGFNMVSVDTQGTNDAQLTVTRVFSAAGTLSVTCVNNGTQAVNGNINLSFWIM